MVQVPHHVPEHSRRVRVAVRQAHRPEEDRGEDSRMGRPWRFSLGPPFSLKSPRRSRIKRRLEPGNEIAPTLAASSSNPGQGHSPQGTRQFGQHDGKE